MKLDDLRGTSNALARHYTRFGVSRRSLLTGHSHQAWPDVAREGMLQAFDDAAGLADRKWARASAKASAVAESFGTLLDDPHAEIALGASTHDLVIRFLSALDLRGRPRLVTTDGEFHTLRRQLDRLAEEGFEVVRVPTAPVDTLAERIAAEVDDRTAAVLASLVLFETARIVPGLGTLAPVCARFGAELLVDVYHALGVVPVSLPDLGLLDAWVVGGGYKYLQLGEGNCFLRLPAHAENLRPVVTGWFAEFGNLAEDPVPGRVAYARGADRFAGATYDPVSHYRAARVFGFFSEHGLRMPLLREVSQYQVGLLARAFDELDVPAALVTRDRDVPLSEFGGFLALRCADAAGVQQALAARGVYTDARGDHLRLGPAPYLTDAQLHDAVAALGDVLHVAEVS